MDVSNGTEHVNGYLLTELTDVVTHGRRRDNISVLERGMQLNLFTIWLECVNMSL